MINNPFFLMYKCSFLTSSTKKNGEIFTNRNKKNLIL